MIIYHGERRSSVTVTDTVAADVVLTTVSTLETEHEADVIRRQSEAKEAAPNGWTFKWWNDVYQQIKYA